MEHWTGLLECHAHKLVAYLDMRIILSHSKDCTKCMSQGSLAALIPMSSIESRVADLVRNLQQVSPTDS